jgi:quinoprotein glucose dehydrogenase
VKPKEYGGITAYDMNSGDKKWWGPNVGMIPQTSNDRLFSGVTLPPVGGRGQAQIITTRTLLIYGAGRNGGVPGKGPELYAVDKATGKPVGAVKIPGKTTAVPMTFLHNGRQYIVFAIGAGSNTSLVALTLPKAGAAGTGGNRE